MIRLSPGLGVLVLLLALPAFGVETIEYLIVGKQPHSRTDFVQGLEIRDGKLYQGTGMVGRSGIQVFDLETGEPVQQQTLPPPFFGEGITVLGDRVIQLTWTQQKAFVYDRNTLKRLGSFSLPGQGWGLTNDGERLIYSDGSSVLRFISPTDWSVNGSITVYENGMPVFKLNELEWTPWGLLANVWREDRIILIDLESGEVTGEINLRGLLPPSEWEPGTDVLNGVAYNPADNTLWVTGKNWPWMYQLRLQNLRADAE